MVLEGLTVIEVGCGASGVICGRHFTDLGARVVHVIEAGGCPRCGAACDLMTGLLVDFMADKLMLDLAGEADPQATLRTVLREADVLILDGSTALFGVDEALALAPRAVVLQLTSFGAQESPEADAAGIVAEAATGLLGCQGYQDGPPMPLGFLFGEINGAVHGVSAVLERLAGRAMNNTADGDRLIDLSLADCCIAIQDTCFQELAYGELEHGRSGNNRGGMLPYGVFPGRDGFLALASGWVWNNLPELSDDPALATLQGRRHNRDRVLDVITYWVQSNPSVDDAVAAIGTTGVAARVTELNDVWNADYLRVRDVVVIAEDGSRRIRPPYRFSFSETRPADG